MKKALLFIIISLFLSGCLISNPYRIRPHEKGIRVEVLDTTTTITTSTTTTTTTMPSEVVVSGSVTTTTVHKYVPIKSIYGITTTTTSTVTTTTLAATTTTSTTTTTLKIRLYKRVHNTAKNGITFYLTDLEYVNDDWHYTVDVSTDYNVSITDEPVRWDTRTFTDRFYVADLEVDVVGEEDGLSVPLQLKQNELVKDTPAGSQIIMVGGGFINQSYEDYYFNLFTLQGDNVKLKLIDNNISKPMTLYEKDVAYYKNLEIGVLDTRISGGYALLYVIDDVELYDDYTGIRYCVRDEFVRYPNARTQLIDYYSNTTYDGMNLTLRSYQGPYISLGVYKDKFQSDFDLSCGGKINLFGKKVSLMWYGFTKDGTAKILFHD
jgi:hypothetical protein